MLGREVKIREGDLEGDLDLDRGLEVEVEVGDKKDAFPFEN